MAALAAAALLAPSPGRANEPARFVRLGSAVAQRADWIADGAGRRAYGAGRSVFIDGTSIDPGVAVVDAAFVGRRLFLAGDDGAIREGRDGVPLLPASKGTLHLAAMDTWLVVAEDGFGVRFVPITGTRACHPSRLIAPSFLALRERFGAIAVSGRTVYAAVAGRFVEIEARDPSHPFIVRSIPYDEDVVALAASPGRLYALGESGLALLDLGPQGILRREVHPEVKGRSIQLAGRTLRIAGGEMGPLTYRDVSSSPRLFEVSANDDFFSPQDLSVTVGDTVRWTNVTGSLHNVVSCTPAQGGCSDETASESFTSGPATGFWVLDHTFTQAGLNPYVCQPHAGFMVGSVTVTGTASAPPGVPDGQTGSPMLVGKLAPDGSALSVSWDTTTCAGAADHEILYGYATGLPASTGGGYELTGARCSIGVASPFTWTGVPPAFADSTGFVWWLVVATDGAATEGSWGRDSAGFERECAGAGGSSGECDIAVKSLTNSCPP